MYRHFIRPILFLFDPEFIHHITFRLLGMLRLPGIAGRLRSNYTVNDPALARTVFGIRFANPVGLAAGFDKDARRIDELSAFGFSFIEIGTLTPVGQPGNPKPRLFRLPDDQAIINRMGFNNEGLEPAVQRLHRRRAGVIVGGNIGKNKVTPNSEAVQDYLKCYDALYPVVDYFVVNVSSPNTPNLRELQERGPLTELLLAIRERNLSVPKPKPVLLKIAPDLTDAQLEDIVEILKETDTDGVIATNTTISREGLTTSSEKINRIGAGGLSGRPVRKRSCEVIRFLRQRLGKDYPIIGVGGIMQPEDAWEKLEAGADLVQLYTGFIYGGPSMVKQINEYIGRRLAEG